jgi:hypothetical protein
MAHDKCTEVVVGPADLGEVIFEGTVIIVTGTGGEHRVTFAGDARPIRSLLFAVAESGEAQTAVVEDWQITRTRPIARRDRTGTTNLDSEPWK